jgi:ketosteroid isomerase-like protein
VPNVLSEDPDEHRSRTEIRQLIERWMQAVRDRDIPKITAPYADDIVAFDAIQALQFKGKAAYRRTGKCAWACAPAPWYSNLRN